MIKGRNAEIIAVTPPEGVAQTLRAPIALKKAARDLITPKCCSERLQHCPGNVVLPCD